MNVSLKKIDTASELDGESFYHDKRGRLLKVTKRGMLRVIHRVQMRRDILFKSFTTEREFRRYRERYALKEYKPLIQTKKKAPL